MSHRLIWLMLATTLLTSPHAAVGQTQTKGKASRHFASGEWQVVRKVGLDSDLLDRPGPIAIDAARVVLFDYGTNVVKAIRLDGTLEWTSGRKGQGPGEYLNPVTLRLDDAGRAVIYDPELGRITVLDRRGKLVRSVPLAGRFGAALPGPTASQFLLLHGGSDTLTTLADTVGMLRPATPLPVDLRAFPAITRELIGTVSTSRSHLLAFEWSGRMMLVDHDGRLLRSCVAIDSLSFPPMRETPIVLPKEAGIQGTFVARKVAPAAERAAWAVTSLGGVIAILRPAVPTDLRMTVDLYAPDCGRYIESRWLPVNTGRIVGNADVLVAVVMEPVPHLVVLRWIQSRR